MNHHGWRVKTSPPFIPHEVCWMLFITLFLLVIKTNTHTHTDGHVFRSPTLFSLAYSLYSSAKSKRREASFTFMCLSLCVTNSGFLMPVSLQWTFSSSFGDVTPVTQYRRKQKLFCEHVLFESNLWSSELGCGMVSGCTALDPVDFRCWPQCFAALVLAGWLDTAPFWSLFHFQTHFMNWFNVWQRNTSMLCYLDCRSF